MTSRNKVRNDLSRVIYNYNSSFQNPIRSKHKNKSRKKVALPFFILTGIASTLYGAYYFMQKYQHDSPPTKVVPWSQYYDGNDMNLPTSPEEMYNEDGIFMRLREDMSQHDV